MLNQDQSIKAKKGLSTKKRRDCPPQDDQKELSPFLFLAHEVDARHR